MLSRLCFSKLSTGPVCPSPASAAPHARTTARGAPVNAFKRRRVLCQPETRNAHGRRCGISALKSISPPLRAREIVPCARTPSLIYSEQGSASECPVLVRCPRSTSLFPLRLQPRRCVFRDTVVALPHFRFGVTILPVAADYLRCLFRRSFRQHDCS
jgi:hypothetical protein